MCLYFRKELNQLKEENSTYRKEKSINDEMMSKDLDRARKEIRELNRQTSKLSSVIEVNEEKFKILQANVEVYKNQISALEKQNKVYSDSIIKHEQMVTYLNNEVSYNV